MTNRWICLLKNNEDMPDPLPTKPTKPQDTQVLDTKKREMGGFVSFGTRGVEVPVNISGLIDPDDIPPAPPINFPVKTSVAVKSGNKITIDGIESSQDELEKWHQSSVCLLSVSIGPNEQGQDLFTWTQLVRAVDQNSTK